MKVAVVHEWLTTYAGSERVLEQMLAVLPDADVFAVCDFLPERERAFLGGRPVRTTFVQRLPLARSRYRTWLPVMPFAIEQVDLTGYDLVVSSSHAVAKGVLTGPDQLHLCMCYSPIRYAWDLQHQYLRQAGLGWGPTGLAARLMLKRLRDWDARSANGVDSFIGISEFVGRRIRKVYRRGSTVIYPPVDVGAFTPAGEREDYYVTASRMVPYKCVDLIVEAFRDLPDRKLVVIGDGPQMPLVRKKAGPNVTLLGHQPFPELLRWLRGARAYLFAAVEDFGIAPLEAQAVGTPVIAYAGGALPETIPGLDAPEPCGVLYDAQTPAGIRDGVLAFEAARGRISPDACRRNALRFSPERFRRDFADFVAREWAIFDDELRRPERAASGAAAARD
ncbi:glycosyltransferase [Roseisolibacter sp. H3M3-2]|uniref:glycosyltransferase n=1 Tax=Roseisolibacter sp. H3M3-2 TaxID=3031323 RepID=UPI0023DC23B4|nr:glycosyltransferase [Roseisolibacter sp. H3M3-2]MDF1502336.1 glycosyltransferase [Roseisolibacter sp. H3M3-2]